jgi:shikimate dehydrogenase
MLAATTRLVGLIGWPVAGSLSPRMQNAAFAARGLDWAYVALPVEQAEDRLTEVVRALRTAGFAGANVTAPYKQRVIGACDELDDAVAESGSANTLVFREGRVAAFSTDAEVLGDVVAATAAVIGGGGVATAFAAALRERGTEVRIYSRGTDWPPSSADAELLVHAIPVVDELVVEPRAGQTVVDLPYRTDGRPTALAAAAQAAGSELIDGFEVLVRQGAAAFELWTGVAAPLAVMRAAVRPYAFHG